VSRTTTCGSRIDARRATTVGLTSFATLTLVPLLFHTKPSERALLLMAALPAAALFGYLAGYAAGSAAHLEAAAPRTAHVSDLQLRAAQSQAAQSSAPVIRITSEPVPRPGSGSSVGSSHLVALARPPAHQKQGSSLVPAPSRGASTTGPAAEAAPRSSGADPHLTLIVTQHPTR
jgi:hypothetical protein